MIDNDKIMVVGLEATCWEDDAYNIARLLRQFMLSGRKEIK